MIISATTFRYCDLATNTISLNTESMKVLDAVNRTSPKGGAIRKLLFYMLC